MPRFTIPDELKYFKLSPLAEKAGISTANLKKWMEQLTYGEMPEELKTVHDKILTAISQVNDELRHTKTRKDERKHNQEALGKMNKIVRADWLIAEQLTVAPDFTTWRSKKRTPDEVRIINKVVTRDFTARLDAMIAKLKTFAFETSDRVKHSPYIETNDACMLENFYIGIHLKINRITRQVGITPHAFELWRMFKYKYKERHFRYDDILRCLQLLNELASRLRGMEIIDFSQRAFNRRLKEFEKEFWLQDILWSAHFFIGSKNDISTEGQKRIYEEWRAAEKTTRDIQKLNQILCFELPELIDKYVAEEMPALKWEMESVAREH